MFKSTPHHPILFCTIPANPTSYPIPYRAISISMSWQRLGGIGIQPFLLRLLRSISRSIHLNTPQTTKKKGKERTEPLTASNPNDSGGFWINKVSLFDFVPPPCRSVFLFFLSSKARTCVRLSVRQSSHPSLDLSPSVVREWVCVRPLEILSVRMSGWLFVWPLPIIHSFHDLMASAVMAKCCLFWYPNAVRCCSSLNFDSPFRHAFVSLQHFFYNPWPWLEKTYHTFMTYRQQKTDRQTTTPTIKTPKMTTTTRRTQESSNVECIEAPHKLSSFCLIFREPKRIFPLTTSWGISKMNKLTCAARISR